ncbi:TRAP transporter small permease [Maritimibacter sp. DP1N21-5]|uniref:TRAP transporter small permease n=1 Tax=Maritimibacter sp. DP1N21-5 TaxID=2836867 RepID=UPI001C44F07C|nr:TRAP transporter small permease [Maritimibacter sp. DP1N21-5]MBV7408545.1 TRAP transporter small permease [Maritimibacter sp. DP1N21-5]
MSQVLKMADGTIALLAKAATACAAGVVLVLMVLGVADRVLTEFFARPIPSAIEFQRLFEAVLIFLGLAGVQYRKAHIKIDILSEIFGPRLERITDIFGQIVSILFYALISWQAYLLAARSIAVGETSAGRIDIPVAPFKAFVFIGMTIALVEATRQLVHLLRPRGAPVMEGQ